MFSNNYFLVFILTFFVAGFIFLALPERGFSQDPAGCCLNPGGNCPPGQQELESECNFPNPGGGSFTPGETCSAGGQGCVPIPPDTFGCCKTGVGANSCDPNEEMGACTGGGGAFLLNGICFPDDAGDCVLEPPETGCCQQSLNPDMCTEALTPIECVNANGAFISPSQCVSGLCDPQPPITECCVFDFGGADECVIDVPENDCTDAGGELRFGPECGSGLCMGCCQESSGICIVGENGDAVGCAESSGTFVTDAPFCLTSDPTPACVPIGCCFIAEGDCIPNLTAEECGAEGGQLDQGVSCFDVPECQEPPPPPITRNIPTIGQWGLIAMAGLLGIFSLFIIMRRHRYNVS